VSRGAPTAGQPAGLRAQAATYQAASTRRLPPMRPRSWCAGTRFRWSGACTATLSGAVSAGSNPVGGTAQRHKFEHSGNLDPIGCQACDLRQGQPFPTLRPIRAPKAHTGQERACSAAFGDNGRQAVAVSADRCSSQYPQLHSGNVDTARARLSRPPDRLDATWPTSHSVISASDCSRAQAALCAAAARDRDAAWIALNSESVRRWSAAWRRGLTGVSKSRCVRLTRAAWRSESDRRLRMVSPARSAP
jgi:hypothetical protein